MCQPITDTNMLLLVGPLVVFRSLLCVRHRCAPARNLNCGLCRVYEEASHGRRSKFKEECRQDSAREHAGSAKSLRRFGAGCCPVRSADGSRATCVWLLQWLAARTHRGGPSIVLRNAVALLYVPLQDRACAGRS